MRYQTFAVLTCAAFAAAGCHMPFRTLVRPLGGEAKVANLESVTGDSAWGLDIQNCPGGVDVRVNPLADEPEIMVHAPGCRERVDVADWVAAEAAPTEGGGRILRITSQPPEHRGYPIYLTITMPSSNGVRVRSAAGTVRLTGVAGVIDVENGGTLGVGGPITIQTDDQPTPGVRAVTSYGDVRVQVSESSTGLVDLRGDDVHIRPSSSNAVSELHQDTSSLQARVGNGEAIIEASTEDGTTDLRFDRRGVARK